MQMIFGFNTDVQGKEATYHVQTEDRGARNPVVDSVIYLGGKIVDRVRTTYDPANQSQMDIEGMVRRQHRDLVEAIRSGTFSPALSGDLSQTLSEEASPYMVRLMNPHELCSGGRLRFEFSISNRGETRPATGTSVEIRWAPAEADPERYILETGADGRVEISFQVPPGKPEAALLVCAKGVAGRELAKF